MENAETRPQPRMVSWQFIQKNPAIILAPVLFIVVIVTWEVLLTVLQVKTYIFPTPSKIFFALVNGLSTPPDSRASYWYHAGFTLLEALEGFALGSVIGIVIGTILSQSPLMETLFKPYIVALQSLPKVAVAPLFVVWFGFGMTSKVLMCTLLTFFPLMINSMVGFKSVDPEQIEMMRSLSASRWQIFWKVAVPASLPAVFAGLDMALVYSILGALVGEFAGANQGLGVLILQMGFSFDLAGMFSVFIVLSVMAILMSSLLGWIRRRLLFWSASERTLGKASR